MPNLSLLKGLLVGDKGVGKTFAMDVASKMLTGMGESQRLNQLIDVRTLLHHAAYTTNPVTIEDNESKRKVHFNLLNSFNL